MAHILDIELIDAEVSEVAGVGDVEAGVQKASYAALTDHDFELLLYSIYKRRLGDEAYYDFVALSVMGADRGRDVWLTFEEKPAGLVQCKKLVSRFTAPDAIREVIKFLLFAEVDSTLLPDPEAFTYSLALSSDPACTTVSLFTAPRAWLLDHDHEIEGYVAEVIRSYATFNGLAVTSCHIPAGSMAAS